MRETKFICEKCKKEFRFRDKIFGETLTTQDGVEIDLCKECYKTFIKLLRKQGVGN